MSVDLFPSLVRQAHPFTERCLCEACAGERRRREVVHTRRVLLKALDEANTRDRGLMCMLPGIVVTSAHDPSTRYRTKVSPISGNVTIVREHRKLSKAERKRAKKARRHAARHA